MRYKISISTVMLVVVGAFLHETRRVQSVNPPEGIMRDQI